eukprot:g15587.t1
MDCHVYRLLIASVQSTHPEGVDQQTIQDIQQTANYVAGALQVQPGSSATMADVMEMIKGQPQDNPFSQHCLHLRSLLRQLFQHTNPRKANLKLSATEKLNAVTQPTRTQSRTTADVDAGAAVMPIGDVDEVVAQAAGQNETDDDDDDDDDIENDVRMQAGDISPASEHDEPEDIQHKYQAGYQQYEDEIAMEEERVDEPAPRLDEALPSARPTHKSTDG